MFSLKKLVPKSNVINFAKTYVKYVKKDPGIKYRKKILNSNQEMEDVDLEGAESDFMNVHKTHRQHVQEVEDMLEKEKYHIVKQKYFKQKFPNFLTLHDKEQIRYLHNTNPEEWTIEALSEGFPALPEVIMKIIKSKWSINESRIANHDRAVQKNWEMFKQGQFADLPGDLVDHLSKFTNRSLNLKPFVAPESKKFVKVVTKNKTTEFSDIISSYERMKNDKLHDAPEETSVNVNNTFLPPIDNRDTYLIAKKDQLKSRKPVTLQLLQNKIETRALRGKVLSEDDKLLLKNLKESAENVKVVEPKQENLPDVAKNRFQTSTGTALATKTERDYSHLIYPEKITIPAKDRKRGYTYKLNDCYYDYDGEFLYRVPGMG